MNAHSATLFKRARRRAVCDTFTAAAEDVIARKGYAGATMHEIAREAGCAAGTLYLYYRNKEQLFRAILDRRSAEMFPRLRAATADVRDPLEKLRLNTAAFLDYFNSHRAVFRIFYSAEPGGRAHLPSSLSGKALRRYLDFKKFEVRLMRQAQAAGRARKDLPAEELVEMMHGLTLATMARWSLTRAAPSRAEQMRRLWGFTASGLGARGAQP